MCVYIIVCDVWQYFTTGCCQGLVIYIYQGMFIFTYCDMMSCFISAGGWKRGSIINCLERVEASSNDRHVQQVRLIWQSSMFMFVF